VQLSYPELKSKLIEKFGENYYTETGLINVEYVRNLVFDNTEESKANLAWITETVGLYAMEYINEYIDAIKTNTKNGYILIESAILFETCLNEICDYTIYVKSTSAKHAAMMRDNITDEEWDNRMSTQIPEEQKKYNFVIENDYTNKVNDKILEIHNLIING
jgi:dephospho-CoA kinase